MSPKSDKTKDSAVVAVERALKSLNKLLDDRQPLTAERLAKWRKNALVSSDLFSSCVFGVIEWDKALGRPTTATLAAGFQIEAGRWDEVMVYTPMGVVFHKLKFLYSVSSWDGKDDDEKWRVYFIIDGLRSGYEHFVEVRFNPQSGWTAENKFSVVTAGFRVIQPNVIGFIWKDATLLPKFEVVLKGLADL
jgi:hypothetical protein